MQASAGIRIDQHCPASRSAPALSLCSFSRLARFFCHVQKTADHEHHHSFLSQPQLLKLVSSRPVSPASISFSMHFHFFCLRSIQSFPVLFFPFTVSSWHCSTPLQESQRMQTKLDALTREVFDLQETINWKDKKIGVGGPTWML